MIKSNIFSRINRAFCFILFGSVCCASYAADVLPDLAMGLTAPTEQAQPVLTPSPPNITAESYILIDTDSGKILVEDDADERLPPASLTKIMTAYIISEVLQSGQISLDDQVTISEKAWRTDGSRMFIEAGKQVAVEDLIQGIVVQSGNDASVAMAEYIAGSEVAFVDLMNQTAERLGMQDTHFVNSTGLPDPDQYTTARDLAILSRALILNHPEDYQWHKQKWFTFNEIRQSNRNRLLWSDDAVDGIKTGHTEEAGYCLVASAKKGGMRLVSVIMNAPTDQVRTDDSQRLLNYGFLFFETEKFYQAGQLLAEPRVWKGEYKTLAVGLNENLVLTIPKGHYRDVQTNIALREDLTAPIVKEQQVGTVKMILDGETIAERPLVALQDNLRGGFGRRITDSIASLVQRWFK